MILNTLIGSTGDTNPLPTLSTVVGVNEIPSQPIINEYSAMTLPAFYSAVSFISSTMAGIPRSVKQHKGEFCVPVEHPLNRLLQRKMNPLARPFTTLETFTHHATVWGNGYLKKNRDPSGKVISLSNINPEIVTPFVYEGQTYFYLGIKTKNPADNIASEDDMLHVGLVGFNGLWGYPLIYLMQQALNVGKYAERHSAKFFEKGSMVRGAVEIPGAVTDEQLATMRNSLKAYEGANGQNSFGLMVLPFQAKLNNTAIPNETAQLIETRQFSILDICRMLRVPPHIVYHLEGAKWGNIEQMGLELVKFSLMSWIQKYEEEFTSKLLTDEEQDAGMFIHFDVDGLARGDQQSNITNVTAIVNNGLATPNWGAAKLGLPSLGTDGDKLRIPVAYSQPIAPDASKPDGNSGGKATDSSPAAKTSPASQPAPPAAAYEAACEPLLLDACQRVETKTAKAFERRADKPADEVAEWVTVFANEQARTVSDALKPLAQALEQFGKHLDCEAIGATYKDELMRYAQTKEKRTLIEIAKEYLYGQPIAIS